MVTTRKKPTTKKPKAGTASSRATGAGVAERSKDARPAFGKASPKKVAAVPQEAGRPKPAKATAASKAAKPRTTKSAAGSASANAADHGSVATKVAHAAKTTAAVAVGAVVATVKLASRRNGGGD